MRMFGPSPVSENRSRKIADKESDQASLAEQGAATAFATFESLRPRAGNEVKGLRVFGISPWKYIVSGGSGNKGMSDLVRPFDFPDLTRRRSAMSQMVLLDRIPCLDWGWVANAFRERSILALCGRWVDSRNDIAPPLKYNGQLQQRGSGASFSPEASCNSARVKNLMLKLAEVASLAKMLALVVTFVRHSRLQTVVEGAVADTPDGTGTDSIAYLTSRPSHMPIDEAVLKKCYL
ncbi:unnamed protein product [Symbiodinium microadriaticum]|nr:unnamed protein product [Symbiodinium microadriaticum]